jgi:hypothetical protein
MTTTPSEYKHDPISPFAPGYDREVHITADLNLTGPEQISLKLALEAALKQLGVDPRRPGEQHPTSHVGQMLSLLRRVSMIRHGIRRWNERPTAD